MPKSAFRVLQISINLIFRTPNALSIIIISTLQRRKPRHKDMIYVIQNYPAGKWHGRDLNSGVLSTPNHCTTQREDRRAWRASQNSSPMTKPSGFLSDAPSQWRWAPHVWGYCRRRVRHRTGGVMVRCDSWQPEIKGQRDSRAQLIAWH